MVRVDMGGRFVHDHARRFDPRFPYRCLLRQLMLRSRYRVKWTCCSSLSYRVPGTRPCLLWYLWSLFCCMPEMHGQHYMGWSESIFPRPIYLDLPTVYLSWLEYDEESDS